MRAHFRVWLVGCCWLANTMKRTFFSRNTLGKAVGGASLTLKAALPSVAARAHANSADGVCRTVATTMHTHTCASALRCQGE